MVIVNKVQVGIACIHAPVEAQCKCLSYKHARNLYVEDHQRLYLLPVTPRSIFAAYLSIIILPRRLFLVVYDSRGRVVSEGRHGPLGSP